MKTFIHQVNIGNKLMGKPVIDFKSISSDQCQRLMDRADAQLSPENLTCDGELRGEAVREKFRFLTSVVNEIEAYAYSQGYPLTRSYSEY